jgi:predicted DNA-binding transcriptional regulator AlpA
MMNETRNLLTTRQAARVLALSTSWLAKLRLFGGGPKFLKLGRLVRYRHEDLSQWAESNLRRSTSDDGAFASAARLLRKPTDQRSGD